MSNNPQPNNPYPTMNNMQSMCINFNIWIIKLDPYQYYTSPYPQTTVQTTSTNSTSAISQTQYTGTIPATTGTTNSMYSTYFIIRKS